MEKHIASGSLFLVLVFTGATSKSAGPISNTQPRDLGSISTTSNSAKIDSETFGQEHQGSLSEALFMPARGTAYVQLTPQFEAIKRDYQGLRTGRKFSDKYDTQKYIVSYDRGIVSSDIALHIETFFGTETDMRSINGSTSEWRREGLGNLVIALKSSKPTREGNIILGAALTLSPGDRTFAYLNESGNLYAGRHSLKPSIAYETVTGFGVAGALLSYEIQGDQRKNGKAGLTHKEAGGNIFSVGGFGEVKGQKNLLGLAIKMEHSDQSKIDDTDEGKFVRDGEQNMIVELYGRVPLSGEVTLRPNLSYRKLLNEVRDNFKYSQADEVDLNLGLALNF